MEVLNVFHPYPLMTLFLQLQFYGTVQYVGDITHIYLTFKLKILYIFHHSPLVVFSLYTNINYIPIVYLGVNRRRYITTIYIHSRPSSDISQISVSNKGTNSNTKCTSSVSLRAIYIYPGHYLPPNTWISAHCNQNSLYTIPGQTID